MSSSSSRPSSSPSHFRRDLPARRDRESSGPTPMDLDAIDKSKSSFKEHEKLQRENVCFNCRRPGHYAAKCPDKNKKDKEVSMISMIQVNEDGPTLKVKKTVTDAKIPQVQSEGAIGLDAH